MAEHAALPLVISYGEKYDPAMYVTEQAAADTMFAALVEHCQRVAAAGGIELDRAKACEIERSNLGFWAGYYDSETRARVERLFSCAHPVFGPIAVNGPPSPEQALQMGIERGVAARAEQAQARDGQAEFARLLVEAIRSVHDAKQFVEIRGVVPTSGKFVLDAEGNPVPEYDLLKWCDWFETADRVVRKTLLENDAVEVSTIFLGMDLSFRRDGLPILWETEIFGGGHDGYQAHYHTREEAIAGHDQAVAVALRDAS